MREAVGAVLDLRAPRPAGLSRLISWSFTVHLTIAAAVLIWQAWLSRSAEADKVMTISLAGSPGPATGGATALGGKQVDQVAPEPKRPEPAPVVQPPKTEMTLPSKPTVTKPQVTKKDPGPQTSSVVQRPAAASRCSQVHRSSTRVYGEPAQASHKAAVEVRRSTLNSASAVRPI